MRRMLTDNGRQFGKDFENELKKRGIGRWRTYPSVAVVNARCERFNGAVQEDFADYHEDLLFQDDPDEFNRALADWLPFYNAERPHQALGLKPPAQALLDQLPDSSMT